MSKAFAFSAGDMFEFGGVAIVCVCVCVVCKKRGLCRTSWSGRGSAVPPSKFLLGKFSEISKSSAGKGKSKARQPGYREKSKYATEGDRLLLPLLSDPPRLHLFLSVQRADSRRVAPAAHFYAANIFSTEVVTFLLASFFFLYSPRPS